MQNEEPLQNNVEDQKEEGKSTHSRRAFAAGIASIGAAAMLAGKAEGHTLSDSEIKSKIMERIKVDLANNEVQLNGYDKVGGHYVKTMEGSRKIT